MTIFPSSQNSCKTTLKNVNLIDWPQKWIHICLWILAKKWIRIFAGHWPELTNIAMWPLCEKAVNAPTLISWSAEAAWFRLSTRQAASAPCKLGSDNNLAEKCGFCTNGLFFSTLSLEMLHPKKIPLITYPFEFNKVLSIFSVFLFSNKRYY